MKRVIFPLFFICLLFLISCQRKVEKTINIVGSTSCQPLIEVISENYKKAKVNVSGGGSTAGIRALLEGGTDLAMSSRELTQAEKNQGLVPWVFAYDAIAVIVHPENPLNNITLEDLRRIFTGKIKYWQKLTPEFKGKIYVMNREEGSGTRYSFKKIVLKEGEELTRDCLIQHTTGAIKGFVAVNKYAIGYVSLPAVDKTVKVLKIDNLYPTLDNIKKGKYRLKRELFLVTKGKVSSEIKDFIDFCLKEESAKIIEKEGFIAVK